MGRADNLLVPAILRLDRGIHESAALWIVRLNRTMAFTGARKVEGRVGDTRLLPAVSPDLIRGPLSAASGCSICEWAPDQVWRYGG